jgi:TRAP-type transport system small permease protein
MKYIEKFIELVCVIILWVSTLAIFVILTGNTVLRYTKGNSLQWANEVPELLFPWLVMAGVVLGALKSAHITTTFLMEKLPYHFRRPLTAFTWLIVCALYAVLSVATYKMLDIVHDEKSSILQVPNSVTYACVMGGMILLSILALFSAFKTFQEKQEIIKEPTLKAHF